MHSHNHLFLRRLDHAGGLAHIEQMGTPLSRKELTLGYPNVAPGGSHGYIPCGVIEVGNLIRTEHTHGLFYATSYTSQDTTSRAHAQAAYFPSRPCCRQSPTTSLGLDRVATAAMEKDHAQD
jgi:hypothetical protein